MEAAISAIVGDLINRVVCFLVRKYTNKVGEDDRLWRLNQLLLRIVAVVEEADGRYITNSAMLKQLEFFVESMYQGYHMLDTFKYKSLLEGITAEEVRYSPTLSIRSFRLKRSRTMDGTRRSTSMCDSLQSLLQNLEATVANMNEFVILLMGCERMYRRPYDTYLFTDNFMFGRHVEKQRIINFLLQPADPGAALMVLPVIGGCRVGKKVLISHVCSDERVLSHFSSILHISGSNMQSMENTIFKNNTKTLVVIELVLDIDDEKWIKFYSSLAHLSGGSKMIIVGRLGKLARFGTVKPVYLNSLSQAEYNYLFKMLAFGNTDQKGYPELVSVANELALVLGGSLITANVVADLLRRNLNVQFWLHILQRFKGMVENNLSRYGEHPKDIIEKEHPVDISSFASACPVSLRLMPPRVEKDESSKRNFPKMMFGDLIAGSISAPCEDFELVTWKSRIPPYTTYVQSVAACDDQKPGSTDHKRKRQ
ncbi:hypothetical protein QOZ80_9BG0714360 [Eleusine coracana subsp. coracana]|nr:hypothetical protein QOZ80_9BG0714360 [Eleusine coracana subsp. coracana]